MRVHYVLSLAVCHLTTALPAQHANSLVPRQILDMLGGMLMKTIEPSKIEELPSKYPKEKGAKRIRVTIGPLTLDPGNVKHADGIGKMDPKSQQLSMIVRGLPSDALYLSTEGKIAYKDGTEADIVNGFYNHHFIIADASKSISMSKVLACADGKNAGMPINPFAGASESNRDLYFVTPENTFNGGYYVAKGDAVMISAELVNYTNDTKTLYSVNEIEYIPGKPANALETSLQVVDVGTCQPPMEGMGGMAGMVMAPKDKNVFSMDSKAVTIQKDGFILYRRGHMHDGGTAVVMKINGNPICESTATYGGATQTMKGGLDGKGDSNWDTISAMKACRDVVKVKKGDQLSIEAKFDLDKHPARREKEGEGTGEQMGLMTFMFAAAK